MGNDNNDNNDNNDTPLTGPQIRRQVVKLRELLRDYPELKAFNTQLDNFNERLRGSSDSVEIISSDLKALAEIINVASRNTDSATKALAGLDYQAELLITRLTGVQKISGDTFIESFGQAIQNSEKFTDVLGQLAKTSKETLSGFNIGISTLRKFTEGSYELTKEIDVATSAFAKATGTGNQYKGMLKASEFQNRRLGVTMGEQTAALQTMIGGFSEFLLISDDMQELLLQETTQFEQFGVATATTTKFLQNVTRTTKQSIPQARRLQKTIMGVANAFGDDLNKVLEETSDVIPQLAIYGQRLESVLKDVYAASKLTGMGMSDIVAFGTQFDTFESAAQAAGSLNAVLGQMGGRPLIDTMEILRTIEEGGPAAAMELFRSSIEQSVGSFENLGYWQQNAIADAMGMSVEQVRMMMLQEEQTSKMEAAMNKVGLSQTKMNELLKEGRDLWTELQILVMQFAVSMEKPLQVLKGMIGTVSSFLGGLSPTGKMIMGLGGSAIAMGLITKFLLRGTRFAPMFVQISEKSLGMMALLHGKLMGPPGLGGGLLATIGPLIFVLGGIAVGLTGLMKAWNNWAGTQDPELKSRKAKWGIAGAITGALGGALIGAKAGILGGPWGVVIGALAGAGLGAWAGTSMPGKQKQSFQKGRFGTTNVLSSRQTKSTQPATTATLHANEAVIPLTQSGRDAMGITRTNHLLERVVERLGTVITTNEVKQNQQVVMTHEQMTAGVKRALKTIPGVTAV